MMRPLELAGRVVVAVMLLTWPYIALELAVPIGAWEANAPVADVAALLLLPALLLVRSPPPGWWGYGLLLLAGLAGSWTALEPQASLHELVRKPLFSMVAYGLALPVFIAASASVEWLRRALLAGLASVALISLASSASRIAAGDTLWFSAITGLTNNHKTLAVAMTPALPLLWGWRKDRLTQGVVALAAVAIVASVSRTAWISLGLAATFFVMWRGKPLASRTALLPALVLTGVLAATYGPIVTGSLTQLDALRSRHSLDQRSFRLFVASPLVGSGAGSGVRDVAKTFPAYRVNHVEAHGVVQKVASEHGILGLFGYGAFVWGSARLVRGRHRLGGGLWPAFLALHTNLLLSTETFAQTHWVLFGCIMGLAARPAEAMEECA